MHDTGIAHLHLSTMHTGRRILTWLAAALVLLAVFLAYLKPEMAMQLALQLWSCF